MAEIVELSCIKCGACCHISNGADCRFLLRFKNGKTICRIYRQMYSQQGKKRKQVIENLPDGKKSYCAKREKSLWDYPNCPLNSGKNMCPFPR
jgi:hypothetical protein